MAFLCTNNIIMHRKRGNIFDGFGPSRFGFLIFLGFLVVRVTIHVCRDQATGRERNIPVVARFVQEASAAH